MPAALAALLFSGVVQAAISPPWNLLWLHPVAWAPAMLVFSRLEGRRALLAGWLVGVSATLAIFAWLPGTMHRFGHLPVWFAVFVWLLFAVAMGAWAALFAWGFPLVRRVSGTWWPFAIAAWFCGLEFLNPHIFGYLQGDAWYQVPRLFLVSAVTGASGVTFLVMVANALVVQAIESRQGDESARLPEHDAGGVRNATVPRRAAFSRNAALLAVLVGACVVYSSARLASIRSAEADAPVLRVALVQPNHTIERGWRLARMHPAAFAEDLVELSREALAANAGQPKIDVFVWPEGALPTEPGHPRNRVALEFAREAGAEIWTGGDHQARTPAGRRISHNSAYRILADGSVDGRYDKNILVPFGEYVPLRDVVPGFDRIRTAGNYEPGRDVPKFAAGPARFVFLVCYEAIRRGFVRRAIDDDVNLLVNVTVDAWYGDSAEQGQHLMLAAVQSATNGLPLVRATTTGISAFTDASGTVLAQSGKFTRETLVRDVRLVRVPSLYSRWGDWFAWLGVAVGAVLLVAGLRARRAPAAAA